MPNLQIIEIDSALEAIAIRSVAEYWGYSVQCCWCANSQQLVDVLGADTWCDVLLLACHGEQGQILLPELDSEITQTYPYQKSIGWEELNQFLRLRCRVAILSGCQTGSDGMANTFFSRTTRLFVAPADFPEGDEALKYQLDLLYELRNFDFDSEDWHAFEEYFRQRLTPVTESPFNLWFNQN